MLPPRDFSDEGYFVPVRWKDWLELPVRDQDDGIIHALTGCTRAPGLNCYPNQQGALEAAAVEFEASSGAGQSPMRLHSTGAKARRMFNGTCRPAVQRRSHRMGKRGPGR